MNDINIYILSTYAILAFFKQLWYNKQRVALFFDIWQSGGSV